MPKKLAVFDIDGTIFRSSLFIELVRDMINHQLLPAELEQGYSREEVAWRDREGRYDEYIEKMVATFMKNLRGLKVTDFEASADRVINSLSKRTYRYTRDLIAALRPNYFLLAISGSPRELVERFCRVYGFDDFRATNYPVENGAYTGEGQRGDRNKDVTIKAVCEQHQLSLEGSLGVGDTASDIGFLSLVDQPIAFNPSSELFSHAMAKGWKVVVERKDVIYHHHG